MKTDEMSLTIRRVANGWLVTGKSPGDVLNVAVTPEGLAEYVSTWAKGQGTVQEVLHRQAKAS